LEASHGRGTFVARTIPEPRGRSPLRRVHPRAVMERSAGFPLPSGPEVYRPPVLPRGTLDLSSGVPDLRLVPATAIGRAYRRAPAPPAGSLLRYGAPEGHPALRAALASMLAATRALPIDAGEVVVTRGSQMALSLVARAGAAPGAARAAGRRG